MEETKKSKKLPNVIGAIALAILFIYGGQIVGAFGILPVYYILNKIPYFAMNSGLTLILIGLLSFAFISLLVFFRVIKIEKKSLSSIGLSKYNWIKKYMVGFGIGLALMSLVVLILFIFGSIEIEKNSIQPTGISAIFPLLIILLGWIVQGGTEEIVTRGWLMNIIGERYNIALGLVISSTLFGFIHIFNESINYLAIINIILVGFVFGLYALMTNDLWGVCGMHTAWNFAQGNLFGFEVSGIDTSIGSLVDMNLVGNTVISGGDFGPEAGIVTTMVLSLGIIILLVIYKR